VRPADELVARRAERLFRGTVDGEDAELRIHGQMLVGDLVEDALGAQPRAGDVLQQPAALALGQHALRGLLAHDQHSGNAAVIVLHRAVRVRPPHVVEAAVALDRQVLVLVPGGLAGGQHLLDLRSDGLPDVRPELAPAHAQRARVSAGRTAQAEAGPVRVVVDLDELGTPEEEHRVP
jgi:hypothetical protein